MGAILFISENGCFIKDITEVGEVCRFDINKQTESWKDWDVPQIEEFVAENFKLNGIQILVYCQQTLRRNKALDILLNHLPNTYGY